MDLIFSSTSKPVANTLDARGFGTQPPARQKHVKQQANRTSLFGNDNDPGISNSLKKPSSQTQQTFGGGSGGGIFGPPP